MRKHSSFSGMKQYISEMKRYAPLVIVPFALGIILFIATNRIITREVQAQGSAVVQHFQAQADSVLREMELVSNAILSDSQFTKYINDDSPEPETLCGMIRGHVSESPYISHVYLMVPSQNRIYTEQAFYAHESMAALLQELRPGRDFSQGERIASEVINIDAGWHLPDVTYSVPYYVSDIILDNGMQAKLLASINMRAFLNTLHEPGAALCCAFNEEVSFSSMLRSMPGLDWNNEKDVSELVGTSVRCFYSVGNNLTYMAALPTRDFYAPLRTILWVFGIYFVFVLVFGWLYLRKVSEERYREAAAMLEGIPHPTSHDPTYQEVISAVNTSLKDYRRQQDYQARMEKRQMLLAVLSGSISRRLSEITCEELGIAPSQKGYSVAQLVAPEGEGLTVSDSFAANSDLSCVVLESAFNTLGNGQIRAAFVFSHRDYYAVFSYLDETADQEELRGMLSSFIKVIREKYAMTLCATVSSPAAGIESFCAACEEAKRLRNFVHSIDSNAPVVFQEDMQSGANVLMNGDFLNELQILMRSLALGKYEMIPQMTETILSEQISRLRLHYDMADDRMRAVIGILCEGIQAGNFPDETKKSAVDALRQVDTVKNLNAVTREIFSGLAAQEEGAGDPLVEKACAYIAEHLSDASMSVPDIAASVDVGVQHLSRVFKKGTDKTLVEYINTERIEKAKALLLTTDQTVARIGEATGYTNLVTFTRNFKRYVGVSPTEYRSLNK